MWAQVFKKTHFFIHYSWFIRIDVISTEELSEHQKWLGIVESKIRKLCVSLEETESIEDVVVFPHTFSKAETDQFSKKHPQHLEVKAKEEDGEEVLSQFPLRDTYFIGVNFEPLQ